MSCVGFAHGRVNLLNAAFVDPLCYGGRRAFQIRSHSFDLDGGSRIIARPSGTEPKVKFYLDIREVMEPGEPLATAEARANAKMKALGEAFTKIAGV